MVLITLFEIADFLKESENGKIFLDKSKNYKIGSLEWIEIMRENVEVTYFAKDENIMNIYDFENLINVCNWWIRPYCSSIFIYYLRNKIECDHFIFIKFIDTYNYNIQKIFNLWENYLIFLDSKSSNDILIEEYIGNINILEKYILIEEYIGNINILEKYILNELSLNFNENDKPEEKDIFDIIYEFMLEEGDDLKDDKLILIDLLEKLNKFYNTYFYRKDQIEEIPLIPFNKDVEILNTSYYNIYEFKSTYIGLRTITINILLNNVKINYIDINAGLLFAIINCLKIGKDFSIIETFRNTIRLYGNKLRFNNTIIPINKTINHIIDDLEKIKNKFIINNPDYDKKFDNATIENKMLIC